MGLRVGAYNRPEQRQSGDLRRRIQPIGFGNANFGGDNLEGPEAVDSITIAVEGHPEYSICDGDAQLR